MANNVFPQSELPIRKSVDLLPQVFQTNTNDKFLSAVVDPLIQPGLLEKIVGYIGRRYGKTYNGVDPYIDTDSTLRSRYQLEPGILYKENQKIVNFYDYLDFKNQLQFFGNNEERDDKVTSQENYSWNPPIDWDKFVNYREYYWEPAGAPSVRIYGQSAKVRTTYSVNLGIQSSFILTPDGKTNNPAVVLYRGQSYKFKVNAPGEGFVIRSHYDTGSLMYNPILPYPAGRLVVYDEKLWKSKIDIPAGDGSTINLDTQDWEYIEDLSKITTELDYNNGVVNNGIENGILTFTVPYDAPDILYYQGKIDPNRLGRFIIADIESNTKINVSNEIIGKRDYVSSNGITFTNGLVVEFAGSVTPDMYAKDSWIVEGVGEAITLTRFNDLVPPALKTEVTEITFDQAGFDTEPFDDATTFPLKPDYITIARDSIDRNPWSRYNRWVHRSVLEFAYSQRGQDFTADESLRAKRPIIEFKSNLQLFNHGSVSKESVDYVDDFTDDVFSNIEGSIGYNIDSEALFEGARVLVINDKDSLVNNKIYRVTFITHNNKKQIALRETPDSLPIRGEGVLVKRGLKNAGLMYHFDGVKWNVSQRKTAVNQSPLFDVFDKSGVSFSDNETYSNSSFVGSKILSYKIGNGIVDSELGFSISYLNIDNVGDIQFAWDWEIDKFTYIDQKKIASKLISTGFYKRNPSEEYLNGWIKTNDRFLQPIIDSVKITSSTNAITLKTIPWLSIKNENDIIINFYVNGKKVESTYTRENDTFTFDNIVFLENDVVSVKIISDISPDQGYYQIPVGLEKNPLNESLQYFTLGQAIDHLSTALEFNQEINGPSLGVSNLRDITGYQEHGVRFMKHSGLVPLAISLLCDKDSNIIKSLQYAKKSYTEFKNNFLIRATEIEYNENLVDFVDDIISSLAKTKNVDSPFWDSDMLGSGAYTAINYTVEDTGITTFALSERFSLTEISRRAVYVYLNGSQLLNTKHYSFDSTFGFVRILKELAEGDKIEIREYISTASNHIPPTPTSLGLYKKYTPQIFIDDTYREPVKVIQGHDGSITFAFDDFRDDLLLELEYRIYNNIKQEYNTEIYNIDAIVGGYYSSSLYSKNQLDQIVNQEFLKWIQNTDINYTLNSYLVEYEPFTYTYSNMTDPTEQQTLPGWWRGVYQWFYDTDRPHRCPWEMLGFSEQPDWWEEEYGAAPYTNNNLILWEDIRDGRIKKGPNAGIHDRYKRPSILNHIPVDHDGKLLNPLDSGLATNFTLVNNKGPFNLGDVSPVEYAWRSSSEWPFAMMIAMCLMKPFEFITDNFDRSRTTLNKIGQTVSATTDQLLRLEDIIFPRPGKEQTAGLVQYLVGYLKSRGSSIDLLESKIRGLTVGLSSRLSGFVDKEQQRYLLDSKNPKATSSGIFIPPENYDIIFNISSPIGSVSYSGVVIEKVEGGWTVSGYDDIQPYFNYYEPLVGQKDPVISVGGVSEQFLNWTSGKAYNNGQLVKHRNYFYRSLQTHVSGEEFNEALWKKLPDVPIVGAIEALKRRTFNKLRIKRVSYGTKFVSVQSLVDFILGYEEYLKSIGFKFNRYDNLNGVVQDWTTSCKEFMFWTKHNWAIGSLITLSPSAERVDITVPIGVADNLLDGFYDYQVLKDDGKVLPIKNIDVNRSFQNISIETVDTTEGIYFLKVYYVLKEHVAIFDDRTVFNDVIYDRPTGYRQERIKTYGFRTVDWDGDYTSPGFLFDDVNIEVWQPFIDYKLGDIVSYKSYYWTSKANQLGSETFNYDNWTKLDLIPEKGLVSNFDYKIDQFEDYYNLYSEGVGTNQRKLARHAVAYQEREYLQNLSEDAVTQFQLYQGFIKDKGTSNAVTKVFDKLGRTGNSSIVLNEEWAFRVGRFGGLDQLREIEIELQKAKLVLNPQTIIIVPLLSTVTTDLDYEITKFDFTIKPDNFDVNINPSSYEAEPTKTAGYVSLEQVDYIVKTRDDILDLDIEKFIENQHIWVTFDTNNSWAVLRYNHSKTLYITNISKSDNLVTVRLSRSHNFNVGDIIGFEEITNLSGFFKIVEAGIQSITVEVPATAQDPVLNLNKPLSIVVLSECRIPSYRSLDKQAAALLSNGSKFWVDDNGSGLWEVVEKKKQYSNKEIYDFGITNPYLTGSSVLYNSSLQQTFVGMPGSGYVMLYSSGESGLIVNQIIDPPYGFQLSTQGTFGDAIAVSLDGRFLIVGSPRASGVLSNYMGEFNPVANYFLGDIVRYAGKLWRATVDINSTNRTDTVYSENWEPALSNPANAIGRSYGFSTQGMITIYENVNRIWVETGSFISPEPAENERFGSSISIGQSGNEYFLAVSAPGARSNTGRVYLYNFVPNETTSQTISGSESVDFNLNLIRFNDSHGYYNGQKIEYINGTIDGRFQSTALQPPPPEDNTVFYVIKIDQYRIQLARSLEDVRESRPVDLRDIGIDDSSFHTFIKDVRPTGWQHLENQNYRGVYSSSTLAFYPAGSIVWQDGYLWQSIEDITGDGSTLSLVNSHSWVRLDEISTHSSLPSIASLEFNDSTIRTLGETGIIDDADIGPLTLSGLTEIVKKGDQFGSAVAMNRDGSILVIGAPNADGQYFSNFKGIWRPDVNYTEGDTVKHLDSKSDTYVYYELSDTRSGQSSESTITSKGHAPDGTVAGENAEWKEVGDSSSPSSGKIFVYQRSDAGVYQLKQTITAESMIVNGLINTTINSLATATQSSTNTIVVNSHEGMSVGSTIKFFGKGFGGIISGRTYYIKSKFINVVDSKEVFVITISRTFGPDADEVVLTDAIGSMQVVNSGINVGDLFGSAIDVDYSGSTIVVSSPKSDKTFQNQGSVYVFNTSSIESPAYTLQQVLESYEEYPNELFGSSVSISANTEKIVVGAKNSPFKIASVFDNSKGTIFDEDRTKFIEKKGYSGAVYIFERKDGGYFLTEKLEANLENYESFGSSIDCTESIIVVGSPEYINPKTQQKTGMVRIFTKGDNTSSQNIVRTQQPVVNINLIKSISLYDDINNIKIIDLDYVDSAKLKILNRAEQELSFKTLYDPAIYSLGTEDQVVDATLAWEEKYVGKLWWNLSTAKWKYYEQGDQAYRVGNWNSLAAGASIDVYEWVETLLLPSEWSALADTNEGIAEGISGQPLYPNDDVYCVKELYSSATGLPTKTLYYYWVKNKTITPTISGRRISAAEVASLIRSPAESGTPFVAFIDSNKLLAYNLNSIISLDTAQLNIQYFKNTDKLNLIHNEYQLLTEGVADSLPTERLEDKWIDSLVGFNATGRRVPDPRLPAKQKYGIEHRPNQTMFINRRKILELLINQINSVLELEPFVDISSLSYFNEIDKAPVEGLNLYDTAVDQLIDLDNVSTVRVKPAVLSVNIIDGKVDTIDVVSPGAGYKVPPPVVISGTGTDASATAVLNSQGGISRVIVNSKGRKYRSAIATVRNFSVLVKEDSSVNNFWSIYAWDNDRRVFYKTRSQAYDTTRYWSYIDWWKTGYGPTSRIVKELASVVSELTVKIEVDDLIRIREYANGGWAIFKKISETGTGFLDRYEMVGRQNGTIALSSSLYDITADGSGYDNVQSFDIIDYDSDPSKELRFILKGIKEEIFIGNYSVEWNKLFFTSVRYAFSEQHYIDWAFKTSFVNATHNVGSLEQRLNYKNDNLSSFEDYINEVKPYRTTIREYISKYNKVDPVSAATTDFDLPPTYSVTDGQIVPIDSYSTNILEYPWKSWADNKGFSIVEIKLAKTGSGYTSVPTVLIEGNGTGAKASAFVSNGKVVSILVTDPGFGYTTAPTIKLVGGNSNSGDVARAVAIIGNSKIRTFDIKMKFDRISKNGIYVDFSKTDEFVASGDSAVFNLTYAPIRDKTKINIYKNNQLVLNNEYNISLYTSTTDTYGLLKGKIIFTSVPQKGDHIVVEYQKNEELLDSVNRIQKYYFPKTGMPGISQKIVTGQTKSAVINSYKIELLSAKELRVGMRVTGDNVSACRIESILSQTMIQVSEMQNLPAGKLLKFSYVDPSQLMTGLDFGGVQIQGTTFDVTGGWDALPWFTDNWDSVESSSDYYVVCEGNTIDVTLPYVPTDGQLITVYLRRSSRSFNTDKNILTDDQTGKAFYDSSNSDYITIRIDDPNFNSSLDSTTSSNLSARMPTFMGDGSTSVIEIGRYISTEPGDILIFRPIESDGSVTINDPNLVDTQISGGSLSAMSGAYLTASGTAAEDIIVDGDQFITPDAVPATEENVPGQVLDSVSIKVFNNFTSGTAPLQSRVIIADGNTVSFDIGLTIVESNSVIVYVEKNKRMLGNGLLDYSINYLSNSIEFVTAPAAGEIIEIISIGVGGISLLDYKEYQADGKTKLFLTEANYTNTEEVFVTINGEYEEIDFEDGASIDAPGKTMIRFAVPPANRSVIKIISLGTTSQISVDRKNIVRINSQQFVYDGSTRSFALDNFVNYNSESASSAAVVEVNGISLVGEDTNYFVIDDSYLVTITATNPDGSFKSSREIYQLQIGTDPAEAPGGILSTDIKVYVNNELKTLVTDFIYDGVRKIVSFELSQLSKNDIVVIKNNFRSQYQIVGNSLVVLSNVNLKENDVINVTWFGEYPTMSIISDEYTGGKLNYRLLREVLSVSYVWVYKNGVRLTQDQDYYLSMLKRAVYLTTETTESDKIKIVIFGSNSYNAPVAFEIHKDMLNIYNFKRYSLTDVVLAKDLNYFDTEIEVSDGNGLDDPSIARRMPGIISVNGEKIEYLKKTGNVLSQLRRGSYGTSIGEIYRAGSKIVNVGSSQTLPYSETQDRYDFISDGSTLMIGPLDFVPTKSDRSFYRITSTTTENGISTTNYLSIPEEFGPCDQIEVFVAGKRLHKNSTTIYDESLGSSSPAADVEVEAEFSVDGISKYIRLTTPATAGTRISVIRRTGQIWYERGETTASKGITLTDNNTPVARFIAQTTSKSPE